MSPAVGGWIGRIVLHERNAQLGKWPALRADTQRPFSPHQASTAVANPAGAENGENAGVESGGLHDGTPFSPPGGGGNTIDPNAAGEVVWVAARQWGHVG